MPAVVWASVSIPLAASIFLPLAGPLFLAPLFVLIVWIVSPFGTSRAVALVLGVAAATLTWRPLSATDQWLIIPLCAPADMTVHMVSAGIAAVAYLILTFVAGIVRMPWAWLLAALALIGIYLVTFSALGGMTAPFNC